MKCSQPLLLLFLLVSLSQALVAGCVHVPQTRPLVEWAERHDVIVIRDARVFTGLVEERADDARVRPLKPRMLEHVDVVVRDKKIAELRPTGGALPAGAFVIDGKKRTLLPGLVDAHAHTQLTGAAPWYLTLPAPEHVLEEALYAGTTTFHDMGGPPDDVLALKKRIEDGDVVGPRIRVAGVMLTAPGGYPGSYASRVFPGALSPLISRFAWSIHDAEQAERAVNELADQGVDFIKVMVASTPDSAKLLDAARITAITRTAHARGLKVVSHIDSASNARLAVDNGVDALVHGVHSTPLSLADAGALGAKKIAVAPTLLTFERLYELRASRVKLSKIERETVAVDIQRSLEKVPDDYVLEGKLMSWLSHLVAHRDARMHANVWRLRNAGVRILVGTDGHGSTASFPGGIHEEMRLLVDAGIPAAEVLLGATSWSAQLTTAEPTFGTIEVGKDADLLLVDGDPLADITATERIVEVIARGRVVKRLAPAAVAAPTP